MDPYEACFDGNKNEEDNNPQIFINMAKIGIDARLWTKTGVGRYIRNLVYSLGESRNAQKHDFFILILPEDKGKIEKLPANFHIVECNFYWHSMGEQIGFVRFLNKQKYDLVHFTYSPAPLFYNGKFVITVHDLIMIKYKTGKASTLPYPLYLSKHKAYKMLLKKSIKKSQKIIVPTVTIKSEIIDEFSLEDNKIEVTYEGFDKKIQKSDEVLSEVEKGKYFMYVGNAYPHKNVETVLRAFEIFQRSNQDTKLLLIGEEDYFYTRLLSEYKNVKNVVHLASVSDSELASLYLNALALVSASKSEGFGLPVLESLFHSTPVLLSDIQVFHEIAGDLAVYFNPNDAQDLAKGMEYVVKHLDTIRNKAKSARGDIEKRFSWSTLARQTLNIYESCIDL